MMQKAIEKPEQNEIKALEDEQPDENVETGGREGKGPKASAKSKAKGKAKAKAKGKAEGKPNVGPNLTGDPKALERKAFAKANALKDRYFIVVAEAAVIKEAMAKDPLYEHLASDANKTLLESATTSLKNVMNKLSPSGKEWRVWAARKLQDLKTEMDPAEFHHELMEFPKMLEKPLEKLEGTVKVFKEVHTKMIQAKKGN